MKRAITSVRSAEDFGRARLSQSFFMRDFLYSEIAAVHGMANLPDDPELAIAAGRGLCETLLEPLQKYFRQVPSASLGPFFPTLIADWMVERFPGKPFESVRSFIDATGKETAKVYPTH